MKAYLSATRSPWCSYVFCLPLLLLYQLSLVLANAGARRVVVNGADALVQRFLHVLGISGFMGSWLVLAVISGLVIYRRDAAGRKSPLRRDYFPLLLAESAVYALVFGAVVSALTSFVLPVFPSLRMGNGLTWMQNFSGSLGAGLYEELVFRLLLAGGGMWVLRKAGMKDGAAAVFALAGSAVLFSLVHYVGPYGDRPEVTSFLFRMIAGLLLSGIYFTRGFAVAAWTHALYDLFLLLTGHA